MTVLRRLALPVVALAVSLASGGCFTSNTVQYAFNDAYLARSATVGVVEAGDALAVELKLTDDGFFFYPRASRWVEVAVGDDLSPPAELTVPEAAGMTGDELVAYVKAVDAATVKRLAKAAERFRDTVTASRTPPALDEAAGLYVFWTRLTDDTLLFAYRRPTPTELAQRQAASTRRAAQPPVAYEHVMVLPYTFETSGGDKTLRATTGLLFTPLAIVGDASLLVGGLAAGAFVGPPLLVSMALDPLFR